MPPQCMRLAGPEQCLDVLCCPRQRAPLERSTYPPGTLFARGEVGQASCLGFTVPYPDVDNLRNWQVIVTGSLAVAPTLPELLNTMIPDRLQGRPYENRARRKRLKLFVVPAEPAPLPASQTNTALIAVTNDRSREFRTKWQGVADALLYIPFTPESLVAAMNGAARRQK